MYVLYVLYVVRSVFGAVSVGRATKECEEEGGVSTSIVAFRLSVAAGRPRPLVEHAVHGRGRRRKPES